MDMPLVVHPRFWARIDPVLYEERRMLVPEDSTRTQGEDRASVSAWRPTSLQCQTNRLNVVQS